MATSDDVIREAARALRAGPMDRGARERLAVAWGRAGRPVEVIGRDPRTDPRPGDLLDGRTRRLVVGVAARRGEVAWVDPWRTGRARWLSDAREAPVPQDAREPWPLPFGRGGRSAWQWTSVASWGRWARTARVLWAEPFDWGEWHLSAGGSDLPEAQRQRIEQDRARRAADFFDWGSP